jgi:hypothetical protein
MQKTEHRHFKRGEECHKLSLALIAGLPAFVLEKRWAGLLRFLAALGMTRRSFFSGVCFPSV